MEGNNKNIAQCLTRCTHYTCIYNFFKLVFRKIKKSAEWKSVIFLYLNIYNSNHSCFQFSCKCLLSYAGSKYTLNYRKWLRVGHWLFKINIILFERFLEPAGQAKNRQFYTADQNIQKPPSISLGMRETRVIHK